MNIYELRAGIRSLTVFRSLLKDPVISALSDYLDAASLLSVLPSSSPDSAEQTLKCSDRYCEFVSALFNAHRRTLGGYISSIVNDDENIYIRKIGNNQPILPSMKASVDRELDLLQNVADLTPAALKSFCPSADRLPDFETKPVTVKETYYDRCSHIGRYGYGMYARYYMLYVDEDGTIVPVHNPDPTRLDQLVDYQREKNIIVENTLALLKGKPAANILLTGDAGTGKSSTIKAVVNELHDQGLRILEIRKEQLHLIPSLLDELGSNPLKFILFIDDLSFSKDDDNFSALKAILEGSVSARSGNVVIYATSNRRHLVKETFSDREGDELHRNDTMQEIISLSDRFGIHVTFRRPDKATYLNIVHYLAKENGLTLTEAELDAGAEQFALGRGNRSARAAKQFIDQILSKEE